MTVEKLKIFLGKKLGYAKYPHFQVRLGCDFVTLQFGSRVLIDMDIVQILITAGERVVALPESVTLALIRRDICDNPDSEMILYYRIFPQC